MSDDSATGDAPTPTVLATTVPELLAAQHELLVECFGPTTLVVRYGDESELLAAAEAFGGQLTAAVHGEGVRHRGARCSSCWPTGADGCCGTAGRPACR